ncbi:MAG: PepSY domain-containing protein [Chitinophagaceae bacterium]|jgi:uncharacterized iron-regulated membrane protein|nr:PepSY domain-containing protein [Chitinophagaceae bacterium]
MFSKIKKLVRQIHLWLGLLSGLVVFIVAITGALWVFESELSNSIYPYRKVLVEKKGVISIDTLKKIVEPHLSSINAISFLGKDRSIEVRSWTKIDGKLKNNYVYLNPYTGALLATRIDEANFFDIVVELHTNLCLGDFGATIVSYATFIFFFLLITGIYLWWPRNKKNVKQRFVFKWKALTNWKRKNFDLHTILGFYASWIIIFAVITGLAWSFNWMDKLIYSVSTLGKPYKDYTEAKSISKDTELRIKSVEDEALNFAIQNYSKEIESWYFYFPQSKDETISIYINPDADTWYKASNYFFDQRSGKLLLVEHPEDMNNGQAIRNMYYDIHIGKILGLPGQLLAFFACLIIASLPITGFLIWYGRKKKIQINKVEQERLIKQNSKLTFHKN